MRTNTEQADINLINDRVKYYQIFGKKYQKNLKLYNQNKSKNNFPSFKDEVLSWLFSFDIQTKMIICSIESKAFTETVFKLYLDYKKKTLGKFIIPTIEDLSKLKKDDISCCDDEFFIKKSLSFYPSEAKIIELDKYSNYITLSENILQNIDVFKNDFDEISSFKCFSEPIKVKKDQNKYYFDYPLWISSRIGDYYSLSQFLVGCFEQIISIKFIVCYNESIESIYNNCFLKELIDKREKIIDFLKGEKINSFYNYLDVEKLVESIYSNTAINEFVMGHYGNNYFNQWLIKSAIFCVEKNFGQILDDVSEKINIYSDDDIDEFFNLCFLIPACKLFTYDDFLLRGIVERMMDKYSEKLCSEIIEENKGGKKKGRKKNKKKLDLDNNKILSNSENLNQNINDTEGFVNKNVESKEVEEECNEAEANNDNCIISTDKETLKKSGKKAKEKKFFLYDTVKHSKRKNKNINSKLSPSDSSSNKGIAQEEEINSINVNKITIINTNSSSSLGNQLSDQIEKTKYIDPQGNSPKKENQLSISSKINSITITGKVQSPKQNISQIQSKSKDQDLKDVSSKTTFINSPLNSDIIPTIKTINTISANIHNINTTNNTTQSNSFTISNTTTSTAASSNNPQNISTNINTNLININNFNLLLNNPIIIPYDKSAFSYSQNFDYFISLLNSDIYSYIKEEEELLTYLREAKLIIKNFLSKIINKVYPDCQAELFGSCCYQTDIESSDVDICINTDINSNKKYELMDLVLELKKDDSVYQNIIIDLNPILTASVPVIKLVIDPMKMKNKKINNLYQQIHKLEFYQNYLFNKDDINYIKVDITMNSINRLQINYLNNCFNSYHDGKYIIKIIKRILYIKKFNITYNGGMSSYCLTVLVYTFITPKLSNNNSYFNIFNLAKVFYEFINFFLGFDFEHTIVNYGINNLFMYVDKLEVVPTIIDPVTGNNLGKSLYLIKDIQQLIRDVYIRINMFYSQNQLYMNKRTNIIKGIFKQLGEEKVEIEEK